MPTLEELEREAMRRVLAVADSPSGRLELRQQFYASYGFPVHLAKERGLVGEAADEAEAALLLSGEEQAYGFGRAEIDFLQWEIRRGALAPLDAEAPGSPWWREVQQEFSRVSILAGLVLENGMARDGGLSSAVQHWLAYFDHPTSKTFYKAHNHGIIAAYAAAVPLAHRESADEQCFLDEVLYRLIFAQALVEGTALGIVGEIAADPRLFSVEFITSLHGFYPSHYPLTPREVRFVRHESLSVEGLLVRALDVDIILPHLRELYGWAAELNDSPALLAWITAEDAPDYPEPVRPPDKPRKIAVLGGGMAALSAVHELTRYPDWPLFYDITVYQLGWRCGGKAATGRGPNDRIEERGLHIMQGWYDNAWRLVQQVYAEREQRGLAPDTPYPTWQSAFCRNDSTILTEWLGARGWVNWPMIFPVSDEEPGSGGPDAIWDRIQKLIKLTLELLFGSPYSHHTGPLAQDTLRRFFPEHAREERGGLWGLVSRLERAAERLLGEVEAEAEEKLLDALHAMVEELDNDTELALHSFGSLIDVLEHMWRWLVDEVDAVDDRLRRIVLALELLWVNLKGLLADVWDPGHGWFDFGPITELDYRAWIRSHGASEAACSSVIVKFFYTGTFANQYPGDQQGGLLSAGAAVQFVLASSGYKGGFVYQSRSGTGDTLVMPIFQVLRARGVKFAFFHQVDKIHWSEGAEVERIDMSEQVTLTVDAYDPVRPVKVAAGTIDAWPAEPNYAQIDPEQAAALQEKRVNLESPWADWQPVATKTLVKGEDFDDIVLGIPIKALESICADFRDESEAWAAMFDSVQTTITIAAQLYFRPSLREMGYIPSEWGMGETHCAVNAVTYANPQYSWVDTSQVLPSENWPADNQPQVIGLWCGAEEDPLVTPPYTDHGYPERAAHDVQVATRQWIHDNMGWFLPKATAPTAPAGIDLAVLADAENRSDATRQQKWHSQYFVANVAPDLRYTLAVPGSNKHRLKADGSGFDNLFLCGDWIDFGINVGYMEGAVISGMQAAQALRNQRMQLSDHDPIWVAADLRPR